MIMEYDMQPIFDLMNQAMDKMKELPKPKMNKREKALRELLEFVEKKCEYPHHPASVEEQITWGCYSDVKYKIERMLKEE